MAPDQQLSFHLNSTDPQEKRSPMGVSPEDGGRRVGTSGARKHAQMEGPRGVWRPIHYLGSKLRLLEDICQAVDEADPSGGTVLDLFAGSGTVSRAFSDRRRVICADVQEYSRVLCSAVLTPSSVNTDLAENLIAIAKTGEAWRLLRWAVEPMIAAESEALRLAQIGKPEDLCEFLENCSLVVSEIGGVERSETAMGIAIREARDRLARSGLEKDRHCVVTKYYGGLYFSFEQAAQIDALLAVVRELPESKRDTYLAAVLSTSSDVVNTVGKHFAQPIRPRGRDGRPKHNLVERVLQDRATDVFERYGLWLRKYRGLAATAGSHKVIRGDFRDVLGGLGGEVSVVYADPPYTRDHYSRFYHVLETMCLGDVPSVATVKVGDRVRATRGVYRVERHQSPFSIKSQAPGAFWDLFDGVKRLQVPLVLSYSPYLASSKERPRLMTLEGIEDLARRCFGRVEVVNPGRLSHSKLNRADRNASIRRDAERLLICTP